MSPSALCLMTFASMVLCGSSTDIATANTEKFYMTWIRYGHYRSVINTFNGFQTKREYKCLGVNISETIGLM